MDKLPPAEDNAGFQEGKLWASMGCPGHAQIWWPWQGLLGGPSLTPACPPPNCGHDPFPDHMWPGRGRHQPRARPAPHPRKLTTGLQGRL